MRIASKIWKGGWGAVFLFLYSVIALHFVAPETLYIQLAALVPPILVLFLADYFNFQLVDFFAGGNLRRSADQIEHLTGEDHYYEGTSEQVQQRVDEFDNHAYEYTVSILSSVVIAATSPFLGFYVRNYIGAFAGLIVSAIAIQWLGRRSIQELNSLSKDLVEPYKAKHENP